MLYSLLICSPKLLLGAGSEEKSAKKCKLSSPLGMLHVCHIYIHIYDLPSCHGMITS